MSCLEHAALSRRHLLGATASLALWGMMPKLAIAGTREPRFLTIVLRGAVDGLALAAPVGDPDYVRLCGKLAVPRSGDGAGLPLDGFFALNAAMPFLHSLYLKREALILHAVATPYRGRSHFDGQDVLESGLGGVARSDTGWLNRALAGLPHAGASEPPKGFAMGAVVPLVMRGTAPVMSWTPKANHLPLREQTVERLMSLYLHTDAALAKAFAEGMAIDRLANAGTDEAAAAMMANPAMANAMTPKAAPVTAPAAHVAAKPTPAPPRPFREFIETAEAAAKFMTTAGGPRIGALSFDGWDTHANEGSVSGPLAGRFGGLDNAIKAFADGMGPAWKDTVVLLVTEFGRTARINGTAGTDHGTGTVAIVLGGGVKGGRLLADWPGLRDADLYEARDLKPTRDLRSITKGILRDHLGIPDGALAETVFPGSAGVKGVEGLLG
ncbi:MAG: DUF1501 domain-containing protein [Hyphomicrobiaceae bacterium]